MKDAKVIGKQSDEAFAAVATGVESHLKAGVHPRHSYVHAYRSFVVCHSSCIHRGTGVYVTRTPRGLIRRVQTTMGFGGKGFETDE